MKAYLSDIMPITLLVIPLYIAMIFIILKLTYERVLLKDRFNTYFLAFIVLVYMSIFLVDMVINIIPYFSDSEIYTEIIKNGFLDGKQAFEVVFGFRWISWLVRKLSFNNVGYYIVLNFAVNHLGIILLWKAWLTYKRYKVSVKQQRWYLIITTLYPMSLIISLVPLRESYFTLFFAIFIIGYCNKKTINIPTILGLVGLFLLRKEYVLIASALIFFKFYNNIRFKNKIVKYLVLIMMGLMGYYFVSFLGRTYFNINVSPNGLARFRNYQFKVFEHTGMNYPMVSWNSWVDIMMDTPGLVIQYLLAPFPVLIKINPFSMLVYSTDGFFVAIIIIAILLKPRIFIRNGSWSMIAITVISANSLTEYFLTGAVRHRYIAVLVLIALLTDRIKEGNNNDRSFIIDNE